MAIFEGSFRHEAERLIARYPHSRSALLPLLYLAQSAEGHLSREGMQECGELLGLTTAEVESVATFYTMYKPRPTGRWLVSICTNVSCAVRGGRRLYERARDELGPTAEEVSPDGAITLEEVECLGACDAAPVVQVNYCSYDRVGDEELVSLIERLRNDDPPEPTRGPAPVDHAATSRILAGVGSMTSGGSGAAAAMPDDPEQGAPAATEDAPQDGLEGTGPARPAGPEGEDPRA